MARNRVLDDVVEALGSFPVFPHDNVMLLNDSCFCCSIGGIRGVSFDPSNDRRQRKARASGKTRRTLLYPFPSRVEEERREIARAIRGSDGAFNTCPEDLASIILDYAVWDVHNLDVGAHLDVRDACGYWYAAKILARKEACGVSHAILPFDSVNQAYGRERRRILCIFTSISLVGAVAIKNASKNGKKSDSPNVES